MSDLVVVAVPREDDYVWKISSEKVPHVTLLKLGEQGQVAHLEQIIAFVEHAVATSLSRFSLWSERRGVLGKDDADVLFFEEDSESRRLREFRALLLKDDNIAAAHQSIPQFEGWMPHLTLGYPTSPANDDLRDNPDIRWVDFDKVSVWTEDSAGPEFTLKANNYMDVAMTALSHHGVKGMRWGVRKKDTSPVPVSVRTVKVTKLKADGGENQPPHADAVLAKAAIQKIKKSGLQSASNEELAALANRLSLEEKVSKLGDSELSGPGKQFVDFLLMAPTKK